MTDRTLSLLRLARGRLLWSPLIHLAAAVVFWLVGTAMLDTAARLDREGVETQATVLERRIVQERGRDGSTSTAYRVRVEFQAGGTVIERAFDLRRSIWDSAQPGTTLPLRYVPAEPTLSELEAGSQRSGGQLFAALSLVLAVAALGSAGYLGRDLPAVFRAHRHGAWRQARVEAHLPSRIRVNRTALKRLSWRDETGATGRSRAHRPDRLPAPGAAIAVLVDPTTGQGWWEGDL